MNIDKKEIIDSINTIGFERTRRKFKSRFEEATKELWHNLYPPEKLGEVLYYVYTGKTAHNCKYGNRVRFGGQQKGYLDVCNESKSGKCKCAKEAYSEKMASTWKNKTREELDEIDLKKQKTNLKKYGVKNTFQCENNRGTKDKTPEEKEEIRKKTEETNIRKYGCPSPMQNPEIRKKTEETNIQRYGETTPLKSQEVRKKISETNTKKYGGKSPMASQKVRDKVIDTKIERYGTSNNFNNDLPSEVKELISSKEKLTEYMKDKSPVQAIKELGINSSYFYVILRRLEIPVEYTKRNSISGKQQDIMDYLSEINVEYQSSNKTILKPKEIDIVIEDHKLCIEFNGLFWYGEERTNRDKNYHKNKTIGCNNKGYNLIHIFEDEWDDNPEIVKSIINSKICINEKIYARKCNIQEISEDESKLFLDMNHIQSNSICSTKRYGLFYNNELISVMTFQYKKGMWELKRFANKLGYNVIGGASKLFKNFIKDNDPQEIFSYCDLRYFNGEVYQKLGFKFDKNTDPGYFYIKNNRRYHRLNFTKEKLIKMGHDKSKTEREIMISLGYDIIWDCGHGKWIWKKDNNNEEN